MRYVIDELDITKGGDAVYAVKQLRAAYGGGKFGRPSPKREKIVRELGEPHIEAFQALDGERVLSSEAITESVDRDVKLPAARIVTYDSATRQLKRTNTGGLMATRNSSIIMISHGTRRPWSAN